MSRKTPIPPFLQRQCWPITYRLSVDYRALWLAFHFFDINAHVVICDDMEDDDRLFILIDNAETR